MSTEVNPVNPNAPVNADAEVAAIQAQAVSTQPPGTVNAKTTISNNMAALQQNHPEMHKGILEGIANTILSHLRRHQRRMKKLMKEGYRGNR